jgi:hypothetical protein
MIIYPLTLFAMEDPESYPWKQGLAVTFNRGISRCNTAKALVEEYKTFATYGLNASSHAYKEIKRRFEENITYFQVAEKHYFAAERKYAEALQMLIKARTAYEKGKASSTRAQDRDLSTHQMLTNNQLKTADKLYHDAKQVILEGNREFNQATRYYNDGAEIYNLKTEEELPLRHKFHRWPPEKL